MSELISSAAGGVKTLPMRDARSDAAVATAPSAVAAARSGSGSSSTEFEPEPTVELDSPTERSPVARLGVVVALGAGGVVKAINLSRILAKYPEASRRGELPFVLSQTAVLRPDSRIINPEAPRIATRASNGMSFTRFDELAMKSAVLLDSSIAVLHLASGAFNLADAIKQDGPWQENLSQSTSGRSGVIEVVDGTIGVSIFGAALYQSRHEAAGIVPRLLAAATSPLVARPLFAKLALGSSVTLLGNEWGYLDGMNAGDDREIAQVLHDAARNTPLLNSEVGRSIAIAGGGALTGALALTSMHAGGLGAVGAGTRVAGLAIAGLAAAQATDALDFLNSEDRMP